MSLLVIDVESYTISALSNYDHIIALYRRFNVSIGRIFLSYLKIPILDEILGIMTLM